MGTGKVNKNGITHFCLEKNIRKVSYWFQCSIKINEKTSKSAVKWSYYTTGICNHQIENSLADIKVSFGECGNTKKIQLIPLARQWLYNEHKWDQSYLTRIKVSH